MRIFITVLLACLLVGCIPAAKRAEIEGRIARLQAQTEAVVEGIKAGKIPMEEGMALIGTFQGELKQAKADWDEIANAPWYTKLDGLLTLVLGAGSAFGIPVAWIQRIRAIRNSKITEAVIQGVEGFAKTREDNGGGVKESIAAMMSRMGVSAEGHAAVKAATE